MDQNRKAPPLLQPQSLLINSTEHRNDNQHNPNATTMEKLESSLANCRRICFVSEPDYVKSKRMHSDSIFEHGGIEGDVKVFAVNDTDTFKSMDTKKPRSEALFTFHVVCQNRTRGDLNVTVLDSDDQVLATLVRPADKSLFSSKPSAETIAFQFQSNNDFSATIVPTRAENRGSIECCNATDTTKFGFSARMPTWQASTKWLLCAFVSFIPTFGIGGIVGFCMGKNSTLITSVKKTNASSDTSTELPDAESKGDLTFVRLDGLSEGKEKFGLILLFGYFAASIMAKPPVNHNV